MVTQKIIRFLIRLILPLIARVEIRGVENLPQSSGFVIAANHLGRLDTAILFYAIDREDIILPTAEKYKNHWLFGPLTRGVGGFFIDRFNPDISAVREVLRRMKQGGVLVIAPEGTRSKTCALQEGKPGVVFFAARTGVPVVPVAMTGTEDSLVLSNLKRLRRTHITVQAGKPFMLATAHGKQRESLLQDQTDEIMCRIAAMLPESYRGVYANHPRLKALETH